ncbi:F0F1 ATP synthase subunit delta [Mesomycoplasma hyopneumoniae]|uniref:F0F1 ATP synthase subunit delta n=1 Tax=Mesomycoplasma hyopneumoniae TaxID=2099 RepID=UPI00136CA1D2|nr:F0F1 ATP synthase subunit delta [Mesomycoplasma hyopneumoniae]MXR33364.1 ATP synthase F1 subunit delta [Mesomycoplasma hyopneumoniae]
MYLYKKNYYGYAESLLDISISENNVEKYINDCFFILSIIQNNQVLILLFKSHFIGKQEKFNIIDKIFSAKIEKILVNFLKVIAKNNLFLYYKQILLKYIKLANSHLSQTWGEIETAFPISSVITSSFESILSKKLEKKVHLRHKINSKLISGIRIIVDNQIFENSLFSELKLLKQNLKKHLITKNDL